MHAPIARLQADLAARATERSRTFWNDYLKGDATFRGVPMGQIRKAVHRWWGSEALGDRPLAARKQLALVLFEEELAEDRLAGVLVLAEILADELSAADLPAFADLFARGRIADWNLCDWFCVKVLGPLVARDPAAADGVTAWRDSPPLWQRRASLVAFVNHAPHGDAVLPGLTERLIATAAVVVRDPARFAQTAVGWTLRELSVAAPREVTAFGREQVDALSREAMRALTKKLPPETRRSLLALQEAR